MSTELNEMTLVKNYKTVGVAECGKTVSNRKRCSVLGKLVYSVLNELFGFGVKSGCSFVKDEYLRVVDKSTRYCNTLSFTAGEGITLFADHSVVALGEVHYEVVSVCELCGGYNFLVGCVRLSVLDVVSDRAGEEVRLLKNYAYL